MCTREGGILALPQGKEPATDWEESAGGASVCEE